MMRMPQSVRVGAITFDLEFIKDLRDEEDHRRLDGKIRFGSALLHVEAMLGHQARMQTIMHEVVHEIRNQAGGPRMSETQIDQWAYLLYGFIKDNPKLMAALMDKEAR